MEISKIPTAELILDLKESIRDIRVCEQALALIPPIETYSGGNVKERLENNQVIAEKIKRELRKRGFREYV